MTSRRTANSHTATVPRKRRPRAAAGEVFITSQSRVYLQQDRHEPSIFQPQHEPVYQNQADTSPATSNRADLWHFNAVRVCQPENNCSNLGAVGQLGNATEETQMVSVFIGENFILWILLYFPQYFHVCHMV